MKVVLLQDDELFDVDWYKAPALFETAEDLPFWGVFLFDGKHYVVRRTRGDVLGVEEITISLKTVNEWCNLEIKCPLCGQEDENSWARSESDEDYGCSNCGATLAYEREITVTYNTSLVRRPEIIAIGKGVEK